MIDRDSRGKAYKVRLPDRPPVSLSVGKARRLVSMTRAAIWRGAEASCQQPAPGSACECAIVEACRWSRGDCGDCAVTVASQQILRGTTQLTHSQIPDTQNCEIINTVLNHQV